MITLAEISMQLMHEYYRGFETDACIYLDKSLYREYVYSKERVDAYFDRLASMKDRADYMILLDGRPIGEIAVKRIDRAARQGELSVHLQNDSVKGRGYGTEALKQMIDIAFTRLDLDTLTAGVILTNERSRRTVKQLGFTETGRDEAFYHYSLARGEWIERSRRSGDA